MGRLFFSLIALVGASFFPQGLTGQTNEFKELWLQSAITVREDVSPQWPSLSDNGECGWLCELLTPAQDTLPALTKLAWLFGSSAAFALFDYVGFNYTASTDKSMLPLYRALQASVQTGIVYYLFKNISLGTAAGFTVIWWTFGDDFLYYGYAELFNPGPPWESRGNMNINVFGNHCTWAYWTPIGIARGVKRNKVIAGDTLLAQALAGAALGVTFTVSF